MLTAESVADFDVKLDGQSLAGADKRNVQSIMVERGILLPDKVEVVLSDSGGAVSSKTSPQFGSNLEVHMGTTGSVQKVGTGSLAMVEAGLLENGNRTLKLVAYGPRYVLQRGVKAKNFQDSGVGDSVKQATGGQGPTVAVEQAAFQRPYLIQANQASGHLLEEWASRLGLVILEDGQKVTAAKPKMDDSGVKFVYHQDLLEVRAEVNTFGQVSKVKVTCVDVKEKAQFSAEADEGKAFSLLGGKTSGAAAVENAFGEVVLEVANLPAKSQEETERIAEALFNDRLFSFVTVNCVSRGAPELKVGTVIKLEKVGKRLNGSYYVTRVVHSYGVKDGYRTLFEACRPAMGG